MEKNDFQHCCGAVEIGNFYGTARSIRQFIQGEIESCQEAVKDGSDLDYVETYGSMIATTIPSQRSAVTALKSLKFKKVFTFQNPNTGRPVTLWAKKLKF